jgi:DNA repair protein RadC
MNREREKEYLGHRSRLKEKYRAAGLQGWLDHEALEFLLSFAQPRKDTKPIARKLLARFGAMNAVFDADIRELEAVEGMGAHSAAFVKLVKDFSLRYYENELSRKDLVSSPRAVFDYLKTALKGSFDESFVALFLDTQNRLIARETLSRGVVNKVGVYPRKVVERGLYHHAVSIIVAHNHPGGSLLPSEKDRKVTQAIHRALSSVEMTLLDHIIIGGNRFYSFRENGIPPF